MAESEEELKSISVKVKGESEKAGLKLSVQDGGGLGQGDQFLPHKFIKRSFECWPTFTKQILNPDRGYQEPRKAAQSLQKEVGQNIKDKKRDIRVKDGDLPWEGSREGGEISSL